MTSKKLKHAEKGNCHKHVTDSLCYLWQWALTLRSSTPFFLPERRRLFSCCSFSTTLFIATIVLSSSATDFLDLYWEWCCTTLYHTYPHQTQRNQKLSSIPLSYTGCDNYITYTTSNTIYEWYFSFTSSPLRPNFFLRICSQAPTVRFCSYIKQVNR